MTRCTPLRELTSIYGQGIFKIDHTEISCQTYVRIDAPVHEPCVLNPALSSLRLSVPDVIESIGPPVYDAIQRIDVLVPYHNTITKTL